MSAIKLKHSGGNSVSLNPPTSAPTSSDVAFKLPNADGSANQLLKTDGSGNLAFATVATKVLNIHASEVTSSVDFDNSGFTTWNATSVTPTKTGSKFIVIANYSQINLGYGDMEMQRKCTDGTFTSGIREFRNYHTDKNMRTAQTDVWFMDGTYTAGSAVTFTIQAIRGGQTNLCRLGNSNSAYKSSIVIIEVDLT